MTPKEIIDYNRRSAEFLGYELITPQMRKNPKQWKDNSYWEHKNKANVHTSKKVLGRNGYLSFHSDWNWIMEVLKHIREIINVELTINDFECVREMKLCLNPFDYDKEAVVQAINQFLIYYNNENSNNRQP